MKPQNIEEYRVPNQSLQGPDFSPSDNVIAEELLAELKPNTNSGPVSDEVLELRSIGDRISNLRIKAVEIEGRRAQSRRSLVAASVYSGFNKLLGMPQRPEISPNIKRDILIERESLVGGSIFGATERGVTRRFFYDDTAQHQAWFFTETESKSDGSLRYEKDMRYELHDNNRVLEVARIEDNQNPQGYHYAWQYIDGDEYNNLRLASDLYYQQIVEKIYKPDYGITE